MLSDINVVVWFSGCCYIAIALVAGELVRKQFDMKPAFTRKIIHVLIGMSIWLAVLFNVSPLDLLAVALCSVPVVFLERKLQLVKALDHKGMHGRTHGILLFMVSYVLCYTIFRDDPVFSVSGIMALTFGDAAASMCGSRKKSAARLPSIGWNERKTVHGALAMLLVSFTVIFITFALLSTADVTEIIVNSLIGAVVAAIVEAYSPGHFDNLAVPLATAAALVFSSLMW